MHRYIMYEHVVFLYNPRSKFLPKPAGRLSHPDGIDLATGRTSQAVFGTPLHLVFPVRLPCPIIQVLILGLKEVAFHWVLMLPCHCWGEQMASQPVKLYFLATCLKLQLPDMANEFYNKKLKWISCSRCFYSGNYQTFLAAHLSFKRIKLCTSIMCCHWSIAQLYQTFYSGNWINFLQGFFCVAL